eukprot:7524858-Alexandrium_andersonii.AAC.1
MRFLSALLGPGSLGDEREAEAVDLTRALFAAGVAPGEVWATVAEVFSPPRATAQAEKRPGLGVLPGGEFDVRA